MSNPVDIIIGKLDPNKFQCMYCHQIRDVKDRACCLTDINFDIIACMDDECIGKSVSDYITRNEIYEELKNGNN